VEKVKASKMAPVARVLLGKKVSLRERKEKGKFQTLRVMRLYGSR